MVSRHNLCLQQVFRLELSVHISCSDDSFGKFYYRGRYLPMEQLCPGTNPKVPDRLQAKKVFVIFVLCARHEPPGDTISYVIALLGVNKPFF